MKNNLKLVLLVVLLGMIVYFIYDKVLSNKVHKQNDTLDSSIYNYNLSKRKNVQAVREGEIEILIDIDGNAYLYTLGNSDSNDNSKTQNIEKSFKTYFPKGYEYIDGSKELKAYKLDLSGVLTSYYVHMGNGGFSYFIFVKENGKLSYLSYDKLVYDGKISLKNIDELENVVTVVENTYSMMPYAITIDGNEISLNKYIK